MRGSRTILLFCTALAAVLTVNTVAAQPQATAQSLFDDGVKLMDAGNYAEACPKLAEAYRIKPGAGAGFELAQCYEHIGSIARAWSLFREVEGRAAQAGNATRAETAKLRAAALEPRLPKLTIVVPQAVADTPGLEVKRDADIVEPGGWSQPIAVDPGEHTVHAVGGGKKPWERKEIIKEAQRLTITIPALEDMPRAMTSPAEETRGPTGRKQDGVAPVDDASRRRLGHRIGAGVAAGVVLVGVVVGSVYGVKTFSQRNEMLMNCQDKDPHRCGPSGAALAAAQAKFAEASTSATISNVGFGVAGAGLVTGIVLWFTAPSSRPPRSRANLQWVPILGPTTTGATVQGSF